MEPWVHKALQRWPNVPAVFGWLSLDRRGRWLIKGEHITRPQIIATINANYCADEYGRWYFQNGPQRGYMQLAYAPFVLQVSNDALMTHTQLRVEHISHVYLDEEGSLLFSTERGPGALIDNDLDWALNRISHNNSSVVAEDIETALALPSSDTTQLVFLWQGARLPITRLDFTTQPAVFGFVRDPQPHPHERTSTAAPD